MQYQLVLQIRGVGSGDLTRLLQWEKLVTEHVAGIADVDGHDLGAGEFNLFVLTDDPVGTFQRIQEPAEIKSLAQPTAAAYRRLDEEEYTVVWPAGHPQFDIA